MSYSMRVTVILALSLYSAATSATVLQSSQPRHKVEFHLAENNPADGLTVATTKHKGDKIYLHKDVVLTESGIRDARVVPDQNSPFFYIELNFTDEGAGKMAEATKKHIGGLLAVMIDDQVVVAPKVTSIIDSRCQISAEFTKAERIAKFIANGVTPSVSFTHYKLPINFELRLAQRVAATELVEATTDKAPYEKVYMYPEVLISNVDIVDVRVVQGYREGIFDIELVLTETAAERLIKASQDHIGRMFAELINGRLVSAGYIIGKFSGTPRIAGEFSKEEAEMIVSGFNRK